MVAVIAGLTAATASVSPAGAAPVPGWFMLSQGDDKACASIYWGVPGGTARLASCTHHTRDRVFTLVPDGTNVRIRSEMNACLAIPASSWMPGTVVESAVCSAGKGVQQWQVQSEFGGTVRFYQPLTGLCLDAADARLTLLSPLVLSKCGAPTQNWATAAEAEPIAQPLLSNGIGEGCIWVAKPLVPDHLNVYVDGEPGWQTFCATSANAQFWYQPADNGGGAFVLDDARCFEAEQVPNDPSSYQPVGAVCTAHPDNAQLWAPSRIPVGSVPKYLLTNLAHAQCPYLHYRDRIILFICNPNIRGEQVTFLGAV